MRRLWDGPAKFEKIFCWIMGISKGDRLVHLSSDAFNDFDGVAFVFYLVRFASCSAALASIRIARAFISVVTAMCGGSKIIPTSADPKPLVSSSEWF